MIIEYINKKQVIAFGFGYLLVWHNLEENISILKLGVIGKVAVFSVGLHCVLNIGDLLSIGMFLGTLGDLMYGLFFVYVLYNHNNAVSATLEPA